MMKRTVATFVVAALLAGCNTSDYAKKNNTDEAYWPGENPYAELAGVYVDTMPCADCKSLRLLVELTLNPDSTFVLKERNLPGDEKMRNQVMSGVFSPVDDWKKIKLTSSDQPVKYYTPVTGAMIALDANGNRPDTAASSLKLKDRIVGRSGKAFVHYPVKSFQHYPAQVFMNATSNDISIDKSYLEAATEQELAIVAYYIVKYNAGCDETSCALQAATGKTMSELNDLAVKYFGSTEPQSEKPKLSMLLIAKQNQVLHAGYTIADKQRKIVHGSDEFEITGSGVKLIASK